MTTEQQFLAKHSEIEFEHAAELLELLRSGAAVASPGTPSAVQADHLLSIYRMRREHLKTLPGPHARRLLSDVSHLCDVLARHPGAIVWLWSFSAPPNLSFVVFVPTAQPADAVCCRSYDKRRTDRDTWQTIWS